MGANASRSYNTRFHLERLSKKDGARRIRQKNAPTRAEHQENLRTNAADMVYRKLNHAYEITNDELLRITSAQEITPFCQVPNLNYIAHIIRMNNGSRQKHP